MNQEIFDLVHPDDADKIRDQLSATESPDAGRVLDLKSKPLLLQIIIQQIHTMPIYMVRKSLLSIIRT